MNKKLGHDAIYDARELGTPRMLVLGLQHLFAMFGATVLVPLILVNRYGLPLCIQTTLLFAGIGTLLFHVLHQDEGARPFWVPVSPFWADFHAVSSFG